MHIFVWNVKSEKNKKIYEQIILLIVLGEKQAWVKVDELNKNHRKVVGRPSDACPSIRTLGFSEEIFKLIDRLKVEDHFEGFKKTNFFFLLKMFFEVL